jgi:hypothetical protein
MQKQLCFGLGIALFCVATVLYYCANNGDNFDLRPVGEAEALTVNGGGETGYDYQWLNCVNGNPGVSGCSATINAYNRSSDEAGGSYTGEEDKNCGGTCGGYKKRVSPGE